MTDEIRESEAETEAETKAETKAETETERDDGDEKQAEKDRPRKLEIEFEATMPRGEVVSYFEAIVGGLRSGRLEFRQAGDTLILSPPENLKIEVKARQKGDKGKIAFEIEWSDEHRPLEILD
ncbi:MAG TPA: amphi-Trp domain-containing protein [Enhygromyxa sp.]|nr:amphi-Trp domain-containing protein [Enhygromyxa sp.]